MQIDDQFQKTKRNEVYMKLGIGGATAKMKMSAVENRGLEALECCTVGVFHGVSYNSSSRPCPNSTDYYKLEKGASLQEL